MSEKSEYTVGKRTVHVIIWSSNTGLSGGIEAFYDEATAVRRVGELAKENGPIDVRLNFVEIADSNDVVKT